MTLSARDAYRDELTQLAKTNPMILCFEADLGGKDHSFEKEHPERFINFGIAEAAAIDMSAGVAMAEFIPFFSTFAPFAVLRAAESIKLNMGYMGMNINIVAPYGGVSGAWFGPTHHCLEDLAIIQAIPGIRIAAPYGEEETRRVIREAVTSPQPYYIRLGRNGAFESIADHSGHEQRSIIWESDSEKESEDLCIVSIGEQGTVLCKKVHEKHPEITHAHLCYLDLESLKIVIGDLRRNFRAFLIVEEHRPGGSIASSISLLLPDAGVFSHNCGETWSTRGGTHEEVLADMGFTLENLLKQIEHILALGELNHEKTPFK